MSYEAKESKMYPLTLLCWSNG